jgi:hypothetical protein
MAVIDDLLGVVKANLLLQHDEDDDLLRGYSRAAVNYAESYQHIPAGTYSGGSVLMPPPQSKPSLCCRPTFTKAGTAVQAASLRIRCRQVNRYGIP